MQIEEFVRIPGTDNGHISFVHPRLGYSLTWKIVQIGLLKMEGNFIDLLFVLKLI